MSSSLCNQLIFMHYIFYFHPNNAGKISCRTLLTDNGKDLVFGGRGSDYIEGGNGKDELRGNKGRDVILGNNGNDLLLGGSGVDVLDGGNGKDICSPEDVEPNNCEVIDGANDVNDPGASSFCPPGQARKGLC